MQERGKLKKNTIIMLFVFGGCGIGIAASNPTTPTKNDILSWQ